MGNSSLNNILNRIAGFSTFDEIWPITLSTRGVFGEYPIHVVVIEGRAEDVKTLVEHGADINAKGERGYSPLHEAIEQDNKDIVKLLLELGADVHAKNDDNLSSIELAELISEPDMINIVRNSIVAP